MSRLTISTSGATTLTGGVLLAINVFTLHSISIGIVGFLLYFIGLGGHIGSLFCKFKTRTEHTFWGMLSLLLILILLNTIFYYTLGITPLSTILTLTLPLGLLFFKETSTKRLGSFLIPHSSFRIPTFLFLITETVLFAFLFQNRTTDLLASPWTPLPSWFFILFALSTGILFFVLSKSRSTLEQLLLSGIHLFLLYAVTAIMYPLGFGFDAFIHRATEIHIQLNGFITPKTPYYIGQYGLVVWVSNITSIPLFYIDVYLVPVLASLTLPATISLTLKRIWNIPTKYGAMLVFLIPFLPFLSFQLTTPHNFVLLLSIIIVFVTLAYLNDAFPLSLLLLLTAANLVTHPLIATPVAICVFSSIIVKKSKSKLITRYSLLIPFFSIATIVPILFSMLALVQNTPIPAFTNPFTKIPFFLELFARPYWYAKSSPIHFEILYTWQQLIPVVFVALAIVGIYVTKKQRGNYALLFTLYTLSFVTGGWLLRSWVTFHNVVAYEQFDFPLRLLKASLLFLLPFVMYAIYKFVVRCSLFITSKKLVQLLGIGTISIPLMLSFYLSYPQQNPKSRFPGLNVTQADFDAVTFIHEQNDKYNYVVLSNQLVSAAAITKYGFAHHFLTPQGELFYYAVPTGGPLYREYGRMLYEGQKSDYMNTAMDIAGVDKAYFVINSYWADSDRIIEGAKKTADSLQIIDDGKVWVFEYTR